MMSGSVDTIPTDTTRSNQAGRTHPSLGERPTSCCNRLMRAADCLVELGGCSRRPSIRDRWAALLEIDLGSAILGIRVPREGHRRSKLLPHSTNLLSSSAAGIVQRIVRERPRYAAGNASDCVRG